MLNVAKCSRLDCNLCILNRTNANKVDDGFTYAYLKTLRGDDGLLLLRLVLPENFNSIRRKKFFNEMAKFFKDCFVYVGIRMYESCNRTRTFARSLVLNSASFIVCFYGVFS